MLTIQKCLGKWKVVRFLAKTQLLHKRAKAYRNIITKGSRHEWATRKV